MTNVIKTLRLPAIAMAVMVLAAPTVQAQAPGIGDWFWGAAWNMALGTGSTKDFTGGYSFRGVSLEGRKVVKSNMSFGLMFGWNVLNDDFAGTAILDSTILTGSGEGGALTGAGFTYKAGFTFKLLHTELSGIGYP